MTFGQALLFLINHFFFADKLCIGKFLFVDINLAHQVFYFSCLNVYMGMKNPWSYLEVQKIQSDSCEESPKKKQVHEKTLCFYAVC